MGRNRRRLLVPQARAALEALKRDVVLEKTGGAQSTQGAPVGTSQSAPQMAFRPIGTAQTFTSSNGSGSSAPAADVARALGIPYDARDNGELTTRQAGRIGGEIGGSMVQRLIEMAEQELLRRQDQERGPDNPVQ
jgi:hypothetical protein